ncbi:NAD-dependent DNA ligase LigA [uncultured Eubacterium sp.]|uniref:NAD-dependent DNA ligase LigA n=1 Tax=uncultured Eubacterium sp. TaxID=165185 RepID=UPI002598754D|nr:NAD-dependent DNA ligase LigA [uncultured Eubacterium sp.]
MRIKIHRIKELIEQLNKASDAYYNSNHPIMSDYEFDKLYEELDSLEKETGTIFSNSPTQNVGYSVATELVEVEHNHPMLSLDKTKSVDDLIKFVGNKPCFLSVKCDGLTTSLHYIDGKLIGAETRGNGIQGTSVLQNVLTMSNVPKEIPYKDELIIDGETIIGWDTFREINDKLPEDNKYKHPRNLVSGSLQLLDSKEAASRNMRFIAWRVIKGFEHKSPFVDLIQAAENGFEIVPMWTYNPLEDSNKKLLEMKLENLRDKADKRNIPYDGAVMAVDGYKLAESMGRTEKFFRHSIAYKYADQLFETKLTDIEWNTSKSGLINPIAIFEPVDLNGAVTTKATLHNITYIKNMRLGIGDRIRVYRSNMVIPKVYDSIDKSGNFEIPEFCPICKAPTMIVKDNDSEVLYCSNENCKGRLIGKLSHAVSRDALNIDNLSEATLEKLIKLGWVESIKDIYHLSFYKNHMQALSGFGKKSVEKLLNSIEESRNTNLQRFLYSLSIPLLGKSASKDIAEFCSNDFSAFVGALTSEGMNAFTSINGIGEALGKSIIGYWRIHNEEIMDLVQEFTFVKNEENEKVENDNIKGKVFVVTGSVNHYANRNELKADIEKNGGKVTGSVSAKTNYLINNDINSNSSKNKKAKELNIPIITEKQFISMLK